MFTNIYKLIWNGDTAILKLLQHHTNMDEYILLAIRNHNISKIEMYNIILETATLNGHLDIVKYFIKYSKDDYILVENAIKSGNSKLICYLTKRDDIKYKSKNIAVRSR